MKTFKTMFLLGLAGVLVGCKLSVVATEGGDVLSESGTRNCSAGNNCVFQINNTDFSESFTAVPKPGYVFLRWQQGDSFICGDSTNPVCVASNVEFEGNDDAHTIIASNAVYNLIPLFVTDTSKAGYQVYDANGSVIGTYDSIDSWDGEVASVIYEYSYDGGAELTALRINRNYIQGADNYDDPLYYADINCQGAPRIGWSFSVKGEGWGSLFRPPTFVLSDDSSSNDVAELYVITLEEELDFQYSAIRFDHAAYDNSSPSVRVPAGTCIARSGALSEATRVDIIVDLYDKHPAPYELR